MGFLKGALTALKLVKKVVGNADDAVAAGKTIVKGKERFALDEKAGEKVVKGAGVSAIGGGVGLTVVMIAIECSLIPEAVTSLPTTFAALVTAVTVAFSILTNLVRKWLSHHPDIQVAVDGALKG